MKVFQIISALLLTANLLSCHQSQTNKEQLKTIFDSIDSASRDKVIEGIGAGRNSRMRALFVQVLMNFLFPLILAVTDCMFGARFIQGFLESIGMISMGSGIALSCFIMLIIYGGYFLTTYEGCRKIIGI